MKTVLALLAALVIAQAAHAQQVNYADLIVTTEAVEMSQVDRQQGKPVRVVKTKRTPRTVYITQPDANGQLIGQCSDHELAARNWSGHNRHKQLDNQLILGSLDYCCDTRYNDQGQLVKRVCDPTCALAHREHEAQQRRDVVDLIKGVANFGLGVAGLTLF